MKPQQSSVTHYGTGNSELSHVEKVTAVVARGPDSTPVLGGLYRCAKFGWNRHCGFEDM